MTSECIKTFWGSLLSSNDVNLNFQVDSEVQGLTLLLHVLNSHIQQFVERFLKAEETLNAYVLECSALRSECSQLNSALKSEKTKKCSQCIKLEQQIEALNILAAKPKPCSECSKLKDVVEVQKKKIVKMESTVKRITNILFDPTCNTEIGGRCNVAFNLVSQVLNDENTNSRDSDEESNEHSMKVNSNLRKEPPISEQEVCSEGPKRKSPSSEKEPDIKSPKRKSPCLTLSAIDESSYFGKSNANTKLKSSKKIEKVNEGGSVKCIDENMLVNEMKRNILVPETMANIDEYSNLRDDANIVIPETLDSLDDYHYVDAVQRKIFSTPPKKNIEECENVSPVLNRSIVKKESNKLNISLTEIEELKKEFDRPLVPIEPLSPLNRPATVKSPSMLNANISSKMEITPPKKAYKMLDEIFDEMDTVTANSKKKLMKPIKQSNESSEKHVWALKTSGSTCNRATSSDDMNGSKKMKQATLSVVSIAKKQDLSVCDNFNGGVLSAPIESNESAELANPVAETTEDCDSDDSECLVLPSPNNAPAPKFLSSNSLKTKSENENRVFGLQKKNEMSTFLDETYFAPPITSTCMTAGHFNSDDEVDKCVSSDKQKLGTSFDRVPNRTQESPNYKYKGDVVRKKDERKQLPGWDCEKCAKYYELAEKHGGERRNRMNHCSRHRSKHHDFNKTPAGFWDPCIPDTPE